MKQRLGRDSRSRSREGCVPALTILASALVFVSLVSFVSTAPAQDAVVVKRAIVPATDEEKTAAPVTKKGQKKSGETAGDQELHVELSGTGAFADGDKAQFRQRHRIPTGVSSGVSALHYQTEVAEDTTLAFDGRAIFDNHDYLLDLSIVNEHKGFLKLGYRGVRTWYDGRGGYFPPADAQFVVFDPDLRIDRSETWARGGVVLPGNFHLTIGYRYLSRDGTKSSVIWGDSTALGLAVPNNRRNIVPAFYEIDENRHQVDVALARRTATSEVGAALRYEKTSLDNRRNVTRTPGEVALERRFTQRDNSKNDMFGARAFGMRRVLDDKLIVSGAYAFNDIDLVLAGSRIYGAAFNSSFSLTSPNRQQRDEGFYNLVGSTEMREHVANFAVVARPLEDFQILTALRLRGEDRRGHADFTETNVGASPFFQTTTEELQTRSDTDEMSYAEDIEMRYVGLENLVLYARAQWEQNNGSIYETEIEPLTPTVELERSTHTDRFLQKYAVGVKSYPVRWMSVAAEYSYRNSDYDYSHRIDSTPNDPVGTPSGDRYPAFMNSQVFATQDLSLRTSLRLPRAVGVVLRYDWLQSTIDARGDLLRANESGQTRGHLFGGTVTWSPANWWWTRSSVNYLLSTTDTAANDYDTPVSTFFPSFDNGYVTANLATGVAIDANTDADLAYHWLSTDNHRDLSASTLLYGSKSEEHGASMRIARRLSEHAKVTAGYAYFVNDESFAGGNYDYDVHVVTTSVELDF